MKEQRSVKNIILLILCELTILFICVPLMSQRAHAANLPVTSGSVDAGEHKLENNVSLTGTLLISKSVKIDLNGYTIKAPDGQSAFKIVGGDLTISDSSEGKTGKIQGNTTGPQFGGGVYLDSGNFTMEGGTIYQCKVNQPYDIRLSCCGGGVYVNSGNFTMNGGAIDGCYTVNHERSRSIAANYGGGVFINGGSFTMNGGCISNCTATGYNTGGLGGGVCVKGPGKFTMCDSSEIKNCIAKIALNRNGGSLGGGIYIEGKSETEKAEFVMKGGKVTGCNAVEYGGGAYAGSNAGIYIENGTFSDCTAKKGGAGIFVASKGSLKTKEGSGLSIKNCKADGSGGGIYSQGNVNINGGEISGCSASGGGGIYCNNSSKNTLTDIKITGCTAGTGGGIYVYHPSECTLNRSEITSCTASSQGGGGIRIEGSTKGKDIDTRLDISESKICDCTSNGNVEEKQGGGGILATGITSSLTLKNTTIKECHAVYGGGIRMYDSAHVTLDGSSITGCTADGRAGGIHENGFLSVQNAVIIKDNTAAGKVDNCYIKSERYNGLGHITLLNGIDDADIGVNITFPDTQPKITEGNQKYYQAALPHFTSDDPDYIVTTFKDYILLGYSISYDLDGGALPAGVTNPTKYSSHETNLKDITLPVTAPERDGYTFLGWTGSNGTEPKKEIVIPQWTRAKLSYKANWKINHYTVKFESNGGSTVPDQTVNYSEKASEPADPTKSGYIFKGWFKDAELTTEYDFNTPVTDDITLYAKWESEPLPPEPTKPASITVNDPPVYKTVSGDIPQKDETFVFSFTAEPAKSKLPAGMVDMPMPGGVTEQQVTTMITGSGSSEFGAITFTEPGTYVYRIEEVNTGAENYKYDASVYIVTYVVTEKDGKLTSERTIEKNGVIVSEAHYSFVNVYTKPSGSDDPAGPDKPSVPDEDKDDKSHSASNKKRDVRTLTSDGNGAKTGDESGLTGWMTVMFAASAAGIVLIIKRKTDR
jgi:pilin isopeptide linkage protein/uncharacterized repeat protein (TIGR02543 family)